MLNESLIRPIRSRASSPPQWRLGVLVGVLALTFGLAACQSSGDGSAGDAAEETAAPSVVEVTALDYAFQAPDTIRSGWTTIRLNNETAEEIHEISLGRLSGGSPTRNGKRQSRSGTR